MNSSFCSFVYLGKRAGEDKRVHAHVLTQLKQEIAERTKQGESLDSPLGPLDLPSTQRLLANLVTTLNASYPDYDFSTLTADCFERIGKTEVVDMLNANVINPVDSISNGFKNDVWTAMNEAIDVPNCKLLFEYFSYYLLFFTLLLS